MRQARFSTVDRDGARRHFVSVSTVGWPVVILALAICCSGCSSTPSTMAPPRPAPPVALGNQPDLPRAEIVTEKPASIILASADSLADDEDTHGDDNPEATPSLPTFEIFDQTALTRLETEAIASNPGLQRVQQEAAAAWQRARYVGRLPDPTVGLNIFALPVETASGSQRGNLNVMQMIPWLSRLSAREQQVSYEALSLQQEYSAARLRVLADVRSAYYKLYVLGQQIQINNANQELLRALIEVAIARVANGTATQGDVLLGTLELTRLEEELVGYRQMVASTTAELNRLRNRPAETPVDLPQQIQALLPAWQHTELSNMARRQQPAIAAAQLTTQAASWGLEVARRERRPDLSVGSSWYFIGDNRQPSAVVSVGEDAWSLGASVSIPLSRGKYDAMEQEAIRNQFAAQFNVNDVIRTYDSRLQDLLSQARAANETAHLYQDTILPQARQTLAADQESYGQNAVEFDRVIEDVRNLLTLELGYHRALGQLATIIARIQEAVGGDLPVNTVLEGPMPAPAAAEVSAEHFINDLSTRESTGHNDTKVVNLFELMSHQADVQERTIPPTSGSDVNRCRQHAERSRGGTLLRGVRSCLAPTGG